MYRMDEEPRKTTMRRRHPHHTPFRTCPVCGTTWRRTTDASTLPSASARPVGPVF